MRRLASLTLAAATAFLLAGPDVAAEPLRVCLDPDTPPLSTAQGDRHGIYYEVGERLAAALGRPFQVYWWPTDLGKRAIRLTLLADRCDVMLGVPHVKGLMGPRLLVAGPLLELGYVLVLPEEGAIDRIDELVGRRVAVAFNSEAQNALATLDGVVPVTFREPEQALRALAAREADAAFVWEAPVPWIERETGRRFTVIAIDGPRLRWQSAAGVARGNEALRDRLDELLRGMREEIAAIARSYGLRYDGRLSWNWLPASAERRSDLPVEPSPIVRVAAEAPAADDLRAVAERGRELFNSVLGCAHCHGPDAVGPDKPRDLRRMKIRYRTGWVDAYWETVREGRLQTQSGLVMPAWKDTASEEDLRAILAWLTGLQVSR
ncbi:MAG: Mox cytochrome C-like protein [Geminicoccaceae bacterium]|jgi:mono/diheme cytochrome c family protein|nr:MAG: Mox cytochrome C-like protein [Geminicoccaceae bacterium]